MARRRVGACLLLLLAQLTQALRVPRRSLAGAAGAVATAPQVANAVRPPEFVTQQPGFTPTKSGLQIKDVKEGTGAAFAVDSSKHNLNVHYHVDELLHPVQHPTGSCSRAAVATSTSGRTRTL